MFLKLEEKGVKISGIGYYLPETILSNDDVIAQSGLPLNSDWIKKRIGSDKRHKIADDEYTSDLAIKAAKRALENSNTSPDEIEMIILSTISPDNPNPSTACAVQAGLGMSKLTCPCFDISAACSGFIYALDIGVKNILTGAKKVLVIAAEVRSRFVNKKDPSTFAIFGDGAAAVVLESTNKNEGILAIETLSDGSGYFSVHIPAGGTRKPASEETIKNNEHFIKMENGEKIFFEVVEGMTKYSKLFLDKCNLNLDEINFFVPHQANLNIIKEVARRVNIPFEKIITNFSEVGNTSSASIPIAIAQALENGKIKKGDLLLLSAVGAGHTMGISLIRI